MDINFTPTIQEPPEGTMVVALLPDGLVKPIPQKWTSPPMAPMSGIEAAVTSSFGPDARVLTVPHQEFPEHHTVHYREGAFVFTPVVQPPKSLSLDQLAQVVDYLLPSFDQEPDPEPQPEVAPLPYNDEAEEVEPEEAPVVEAEPAPEPDGVPELFREFMLQDETTERFTLRMKNRLQALKHLQIDGTKPTNARALPDMTEEEIAELADLEARNLKSGNWLG